MLASSLMVKRGPETDILDTVLARNVRILRIDRGWSQEDLAEAAGLSRATVLKLEAQQGKRDLETVSKIASAFDISIAELMEENAAVFEARRAAKKLKGLGPEARDEFFRIFGEVRDDMPKKGRE